MSACIQQILLLLVLFLLVGLTYLFIHIFVGCKSGYEYKVMDWNQDGKTALAEIIDRSDMGTQLTLVSEELNDCTNFNSYLF